MCTHTTCCAFFKNINKISEKASPSLRGHQNLTRAFCQSHFTTVVTFLQQRYISCTICSSSILLSHTHFVFSNNSFRLVFFHCKLTPTLNLPHNYSRAHRHKKNTVLLSKLGVVFECCTFLQLIERYISLFKGSVTNGLGKRY